MAVKSVLRNGDSAGGALINTQTSVKANGKYVIVHQDLVTSHGSGSHASAKINASSNNVFIGGKAVARAQNSATCGHVASNGSADVKVGA